ncbi:MAG: aldehyde dehydrogenase family protein [Deltaproteobacteria bacterium]|nr:aldehyde dehydrogenase family protein [Deltaproteobacteria bacterium]
MKLPSDPDPVMQKGMEIFGLMEAETPYIFDRKWWAGQAMELVMKNPDFKVQLFRFVDVFPTLVTDEAIAKHLKEYFLSEEFDFPDFFKTALKGVTASFASSLSASIIRKNMVGFAKNFIAGKDIDDGKGSLKKILDDGRTFTVDILGEEVLSEKEAESYREKYLDLVRVLSEEIALWQTGGERISPHLPLLKVSVKISSLYSRLAPVNHDESVEAVKERLRPILRKVRDAGGFVNLDMEMRRLKNITLDVFTGILEEPEFRGWENFGVAVQAYLKETEEDLGRIIDWAKRGDHEITIRLVKGAYWEHENIVARQNSWPVPVFTKKEHTDWNFERCVEKILRDNERVILAAGTHNVRSIAKTIVLAEKMGVPRDRYEFQMLYGMAEPVKRTLGKLGYTVREYVPVGELIPGMAYLVRRLLENTSNEGFLRRKFAENVSSELLLKDPEPFPEAEGENSVESTGDFKNDPHLDFSLARNRKLIEDALVEVRAAFGKRYPVVIGGREESGSGEIVSVNPAEPDEVVGVVGTIERDLAEKAISAAAGVRQIWARTEPATRADYLFRAADAMRKRKAELIAWQVYEVGKSWVEADADVSEAIDFLEYYGKEMVRLGKPQKMGDLPGEDNRHFYRPRGVALVVAPWNFPFAISAGMVSAALVAGNTVLYKPSSLSPVCGYQVFSVFAESGLPDGVLNFIPGPGKEVGDFLVEHPRVNLIAFTGSKEVGLGMVEKAGRTAAGQEGVKKVIAEMGGKNAIIVDGDADLDLAVAGVMRSAFGYQGQKCSACSRAIVLASCYDRFLGRITEAVKSITVGPPEDPSFVLGPVIDGRAKERVLSYIEVGERDGNVAATLAVPDSGYYVPPVIFAGLSPDSPVLREEIFGPVLAVIKAESIEEAIAMANNSEYALTGGLFSRSPANIRKVAEEFEVGNLYINRGITGALVGRQPFGGFRMSGVGSKAGGFDYLLQFMEPRVVTENTTRRGFSPEILL